MNISRVFCRYFFTLGILNIPWCIVIKAWQLVWLPHHAWSHVVIIVMWCSTWFDISICINVNIVMNMVDFGVYQYANTWSTMQNIMLAITTNMILEMKSNHLYVLMYFMVSLMLKEWSQCHLYALSSRWHVFKDICKVAHIHGLFFAYLSYVKRSLTLVVLKESDNF